jgi:DNA adenine methylase
MLGGIDTRQGSWRIIEQRHSPAITSRRRRSGVRSVARVISPRPALSPEPVVGDRVVTPSSPAQPRPFLKWAGGKTRLLRHLLQYVPETIQDYYEPFVGGGAMFFAIHDRVANRSHLSDLNDELVNAWIVVRDSPYELLEAIAKLRTQDSKEFYYLMRSGPSSEDPVDRAARFVYLNQTAWNGLWRVNRKGEFNVPWGARPFRSMTAKQLLGLRVALSGADVVVRDFRDAMSTAKAGDFVYLDPPYLPLSDTSKFFFYTERRFRAPDLGALAEACAALTDRGVAWVLSNRDTPLVRQLFTSADIVPLTARRSVAAQNRRDVEATASPEVIVIGRAP